MQTDQERAQAAYKVQDYELLLSIALQTIADRDRVRARLERMQQVMEDVTTHLGKSSQQSEEPRTGSHPKV